MLTILRDVRRIQALGVQEDDIEVGIPGVLPNPHPKPAANQSSSQKERAELLDDSEASTLNTSIV